MIRIKKKLIFIFGMMMSVAGIENTPFKEINEDLDALQNLLRSEFSLFKRLQNYIKENQEQLTSFSNAEYYLGELTEVSSSIDDHLSGARNTFQLLKQFKNFQEQDKDPLLSTVIKSGLENMIVSNHLNKHLKVVNDPESGVFDNYTKMLCNGEISLIPDVAKNLKCRYTDKGNLFLKIAPFKIEEAFLDPDIIIYHNILNDDEIDTLKNVSFPLLRESLVISLNEGKHQSKIRISKNVWLDEEDHPFVENVNRRIEFATDLAVHTAEHLQVSYYQKDGFFNTHYDFEPNKINPFKNLGVGNRIATLMFYLSDVEEGGRTVFPYLNVSLTPEKGSAVFWYNLFPNGEFDYRTLHAGCPVVAGAKWVANKWIHEFGQEFRRPCTLLNYEYGEDGILLVK